MAEDFKPFVAPEQRVKELSFVPLLTGCILGIIFGASSLYLAVKVGMTVSASIPVAVISITLFKALSRAFKIRKATILENNIVQTTGSAGESIAFGIAVTMPALLILGFDMEVGRVMLVSVLGALLGILMMIPLRHALMVKEHNALPFPEGTACAEVLIVGEKGGTSAKTVFGGFFLGFLYKFFNVGAKLWVDIPEKAFGFFKGSSVGAEVSPELLGVGYIIGPRIASIMVAGGILSSFVLIPIIKLFGDGLAEPLFPGTKLISEMSLHEIWRNYVLYIGAGAVATGGIISLFRTLPTIIKSAKAGFADLGVKKGSKILRTEQDLSFRWVFGGCLVLILAIWWVPTFHMNLVGAILIVCAGFLFVTVSSRLTGEIGSSSNPISGMTVATLLITSLIFLALGWTSLEYRVTALSVAAIVCVAASIGGTTAQDLKTGYLVGATPRAQQIAILIGSFVSALVIGYSLNALNDASTIYSKKAVPAGARIENVSELTEMSKVKGPEGANDQNLYHVLRVQDQGGALPMGRYLVDDSGDVKYLIDPGINGALKERDDGTTVPKYEAPKARLMSFIIDGILTQKMPWGLVLLGVSISIVLELCGIASLAFATGVYLPLSASAPIFVGGMVRWLVNLFERKKKKSSTEDEASPGVLFSSGLIAGGSICGIALAILAVNESLGSAINLSAAFPLSSSNGFSALCFFAMALVLFFVGRKKKA